MHPQYEQTNSNASNSAVADNQGGLDIVFLILAAGSTGNGKTQLLKSRSHSLVGGCFVFFLIFVLFILLFVFWGGTRVICDPGTLQLTQLPDVGTHFLPQCVYRPPTLLEGFDP